MNAFILRVQKALMDIERHNEQYNRKQVFLQQKTSLTER